MSLSQIIADRFEIADPGRDLLGRGGMGEVYRGTDTQTGQLVAVKVLQPAIVAHNPDLVQRFAREGEALRQLNHPNIVKMGAAITQDEQHYLVMEYVPGGSLRDLLEQQGQLLVRRTLEIGLDLADALTRTHRLGNPARAAQLLAAALQSVAEIQAFKAMALILPAAALVLAGRGEHARAGNRHLDDALPCGGQLPLVRRGLAPAPRGAHRRAAGRSRRRGRGPRSGPRPGGDQARTAGRVYVQLTLGLSDLVRPWPWYASTISGTVPRSRRRTPGSVLTPGRITCRCWPN
jgi:hypothetical protein